MTAISSAITAVRAWPRWLVLTLAAVMFVFVLGLPTIIIPLATDQVWFALGARTVLDGGQLYRDFWEQRPPLIFLVYASPFALVGEHMEAIRVLDLANTVLVVAALFLLNRRLFNERAAIFSGGFYAFAYLTWAGYDGLAETESFMAAPLVLAFFLYRPEVSGRTTGLLALASGLLLGVAFAFKTSALVFVLGLPLAEVLLRSDRWRLRDALRRLALAALGFLLIQGAAASYLAVVGVLDDFVDIQRHYTLPYSAFRWAPEGATPYARFLLQATSDWVRSVPFIVVPAVIAIFFALYRPRQAAGVYFLASLAALGMLSIWWQGKMYLYHWLIMLPLLAPLAGYTLDQVAELFSRLTRRQACAAWALLTCGLLVLAFQPVLDTYDNYRTLISFADGSLSRREVEARYSPFYAANHQLVDYVRANSGPDDRTFVWGLWPQVYFWLDRPLVDRFVVNNGLRATWTPDSWRRELMDDLSAAPPRFFAVARGDNQPWLAGTSETSDEHLRDHFPELRAFLETNYRPVLNVGIMVLYERQPAAVRANEPR